MNLFPWAPFVAASAHIFEEFVFPGRFLEWHRNYRPAHTKSITPRFAFVINGLLLVLCISPVINGPILFSYIEWLVAIAILATNALFHIRAVLATSRYSPGVVTAVCLYLPLTVFGYAQLLRSHLVSGPVALLAFLIGGSYPLISVLLHTVRSRGRGTEHA